MHTVKQVGKEFRVYAGSRDTGKYAFSKEKAQGIAAKLDLKAAYETLRPGAEARERARQDRIMEAYNSADPVAFERALHQFAAALPSYTNAKLSKIKRDGNRITWQIIPGPDFIDGQRPVRFVWKDGMMMVPDARGIVNAYPAVPRNPSVQAYYSLVRDLLVNFVSP